MSNDVDYNKIKDIIGEKTEELIDIFTRLNSIDETNKSISESINDLNNRIDKLSNCIDKLSKKLDDVSYERCNKCINEDIPFSVFNIKYKNLISVMFTVIILLFIYIIGIIGSDTVKSIFVSIF